MIVVGGTYAERTVVPATDLLRGSGLRAAAALGTDSAVRLVSAVEEENAEEAAMTAAAQGVAETAFVERDKRVSFTYFTPLSPPAVSGPGATLSDRLVAEDDAVLLFGMVETGAQRVDTRTLVVDPQQPQDLIGLRLTDDDRWARLAVVANVSEIRALGRASDVIAAATAVAVSVGAEVVVVKRGAWGSTVVVNAGHGDGVVAHVGARPTPTVWPIGSGDVYAAAFTHAWTAGANPVEAAHVASNAAAWCCATRALPIPAPVLEGAEVSSVLPGAQTELEPPADPPTVYLAAPFFTLGERWVVETMRTALRDVGASVFSPVHDVGPGGDEVAAKDLAGLEGASGVLAVLDGWDPGTLYEAGWAHRAALPVVGFTYAPGYEGSKMLVGSGAEIHCDLSSAVYRAVWGAMGASLDPGRRTQS